MERATSYPQIVGQVVRGQRELQDIKLLAMAENAGMKSESGWSRVETGDTTMTVSQLRKAAVRLGKDPWQIIKEADHIAAGLTDAGVKVHDDKPKGLGKWLLGGAAILTVLAGAAAYSQTKNTGS